MENEVDATVVLLRAIKVLADKSDSIEDIRTAIDKILAECENTAVNEDADEDDEDNCEGMTDEQFDMFLTTLAKLVSTAKTVDEAVEIVSSLITNK